MKTTLIPFLFSIFFFTQCSKDRIISAFESTDAFYDKYSKKEQTFTIESDEGGPIIGNKKTELYPNRLDLQLPDGADVALPYNIHLIELYTKGDFVLNRQSTLSGSTPLNSNAILKIRGSKDGQELSLKEGKVFNVVLASEITNSDPVVYQMNDTNWSPSNDGSTVSISSNKYHIALGTLGWNETAQSTKNTSVSLKFTIDASGTEFIQLYALPTSTNTCIKGGDLIINHVPSGEEVQVIAFALSSDGNFRLFSLTDTYNADTEITLNLDESISEEGLNSFIQSL